MEDGEGEKTEPPMGAGLAGNQWARNSQDRMRYTRKRPGEHARQGNTPARNGGGKSLGISRELAPTGHTGWGWGMEGDSRLQSGHPRQ